MDRKSLARPIRQRRNRRPGRPAPKAMRLHRSERKVAAETAGTKTATGAGTIATGIGKEKAPAIRPTVAAEEVRVN